MTSNKEELNRFIDYLQSQLVRNGSEVFLEKRWFADNRERLAAEMGDLARDEGDIFKRLEHDILSHRDQTSHDFFYTHQIFSPLLEKTLNICKQAGLSPVRPVVLANSPNVEPSPAAWPSTHSHILFIGPGTYSFCNYWAKVISTTQYKISQLQEEQRAAEQIETMLTNETIPVDAIKLVLHYALVGSLLGYGKLKQNDLLMGLRVQLLTAMEVFIVAHEVTHFVLHEQFSESGGIRPGSTALEMEQTCDAMGLAVCAAYGSEEDNIYAFDFMGPILFFYSLQLCQEGQNILLGYSPPKSTTHPTCEERIAFTFEFAKKSKVREVTLRNMKDAVIMMEALGHLVKAGVEIVRDRISTDAPKSHNSQ